MSESLLTGYRFLEHTADAGVEIDAPSPTEIYRLGLFALTDCLTVLKKIEPRERHPFSLRAGGLDLLLVDWLQELLFRFETTGFVARDTELRLTSEDEGEFVLEGVLLGEPFDPARHPVRLPVKAVTYHQLVFEPTDHGYFARVIFDV
ncbi:MAG: archease [Acidobacteriota bacterium]|nr:archease [Acidobacteriota bacterium]